MATKSGCNHSRACCEVKTDEVCFCFVSPTHRKPSELGEMLSLDATGGFCAKRWSFWKWEMTFIFELLSLLFRLQRMPWRNVKVSKLAKEMHNYCKLMLDSSLRFPLGCVYLNKTKKKPVRTSAGIKVTGMFTLSVNGFNSSHKTEEQEECEDLSGTV